MDEDELQQLYAWIDEIPLSRPKKNLHRDFSDGGLFTPIVPPSVSQLYMAVFVFHVILDSACRGDRASFCAAFGGAAQLSSGQCREAEDGELEDTEWCVVLCCAVLCCVVLEWLCVVLEWLCVVLTDVFRRCGLRCLSRKACRIACSRVLYYNNTHMHHMSLTTPRVMCRHSTCVPAAGHGCARQCAGGDCGVQGRRRRGRPQHSPHSPR